jgi:membrane associated rhomboid family serine protease
MSDQPARSARQPIFNIPPITGALLLANIAVHGFRMLLPDEADDRIIRLFAFFPARYAAGRWGWPAFIDPISYQFLHANLTHLFVNMLALLAFGSGVERRLGRWRMLALTILSGVAAAGAHWAAYPSSALPVVGASGAISGLFGGVLRMLARGAGGRRTGLWPLLALWIIVTVIAGQTGMPGEPGAQIAWVAHLGGFAFGLVVFGLLDRTAPPRLS